MSDCNSKFDQSEAPVKGNKQTNEFLTPLIITITSSVNMYANYIA